MLFRPTIDNKVDHHCRREKFVQAKFLVIVLKFNGKFECVTFGKAFQQTNIVAHQTMTNVFAHLQVTRFKHYHLIDYKNISRIF